MVAYAFSPAFTAARPAEVHAAARARRASSSSSSSAAACLDGARLASPKSASRRALSRRQRHHRAVRVSASSAKAKASGVDRGFGAMPRGMGFEFGDKAAATREMTPSSALMSTPLATLAPLFLLADGGLADDIKPSYFASLGLFVLSAPGLWSLVKRSAKSKIDRKTFEVAGPAAETALPLDELAREISMFFRRNNYVIADAGEVITFEGNIAPERGTAAYITFCVAIGLLCIGLVCSIALPGGNLWYSLALVSPLAGSYYMDNAGRKEQVKVKMVTSDDDKTTDIIIEGDVEEIERFRRDLNLVEKGKVYVKGILEQ